MEERFNDNTPDKKEAKISYSNDELTVVWQPGLCVHSTHCFKDLPSVFKPLQRKWINVNGATTDNIIVQVKHCPSGALSFILHSKET